MPTFVEFSEPIDRPFSDGGSKDDASALNASSLVLGRKEIYAWDGEDGEDSG